MERYDYQYNKVNSNDNVEQRSWTPFLRQLLVCSGTLSVYFSKGIIFGAPTIVIHQMREEANSTDAVSVSTASWLSSISGYASLPWVFILAILTHIFGRKSTFILISFVNIISFIVFYFSVTRTTAHLLYISITQGCTLAAGFTTSFLILTEYTSPKYRGTFLTMKAATFFWGIWCSNAIGTFYHWRNIPLFGFVCSLFSLTAFVWPESPYWLASRGRTDECKRAHRWLKGSGRIAEMELEKLTAEKAQAFTWNTLKVLLSDVKTRQFYKPTTICCIMIIQYYASGKLVCAVYSMEILKQITSSTKAAYITMLIIDGVSVFSSYFGCVLNGFVKRRTQLFGSSLIGLLFILGLSLYLYLIKLNVLSQNNILTICILVVFSIAVSNVVLVGVEESASDSGSVRKAHDESVVKQVLREVHGADVSDKVVSVQRLGRREQGKKRPMKVVLKSRQDAISTLKNKSKASKEVRVYDDKTPLQRQELQQLREVLKTRIEKGELNLTIKYVKGSPKIVQKN